MNNAQAAQKRLDDYLLDRMSDDERERFWSAPQARLGGKTGREAFDDYGPAVLLADLYATEGAFGGESENAAPLFDEVAA